MIDISKLSIKYKVKKLEEKDSLDILKLQKSNPLYFKYCPPEPNIETVLNDFTSLPPGKSLNDLFYVGFYEKDNLVAILHFIISYPNQDTIYIGLFMLDSKYSKRGIGQKIINDAKDYFKQLGFSKLRLGYMKDNPQAKAFWKKCGFEDTSIEKENDQGKVVILEKFI